LRDIKTQGINRNQFVCGLQEHEIEFLITFVTNLQILGKSQKCDRVAHLGGQVVGDLTFYVAADIFLL
jgi:hypothetical protein